MAVEIGTAYLAVLPSMKGFSKHLNGQVGPEAKKAGDNAGKAMGGGMLAAAGKFAGPVAGIFAGAAIGGFIKDAIGSASDMNETLSKSKAIFGDQTKAMDDWASNAADKFGLTKSEALDASASFGDMFRQIGFTGQDAAKSSQDIVQMATDLGSFNNLGTDDVLDKISGAMRGEYDSLQSIIPNISAARVEQEAMNIAGTKNAKGLTAQQKAQAVMNILHKDGSRAMGDFAKTSGGLANQQKILSAQMDTVKQRLGTALLPIAVKFAGFLTKNVVPAVERFAGQLQDKLPGAIDKAKEIFVRIRTELQPTIDLLKRVFGVVKDAIPPILSGLQGFFGFLGQHRDALGAIVTGIGAVVFAWKAYQTYLKIVTAVTKAYTAVQKALNFVMKMNPIGLVVLALIGLAAALVYAYKHSETFRNIVNKAWAAVKNGAKAAFDWLRTNVPQIIQWVKTKWAWLKDHLTHPIKSAKDAIASILGKTGLQSVFSKAVTAVGKIWDGLKELAKKPIRFIVNTVLEDGLLAAFRWVSDKLGYDAGKNLHVSLPKGFSAGGWTGPGSKYTPAGIVHADEYVIKKESRRKIERDHPGLLDSLNGYANGGLVASPGDRGGFLTGGRQPVPGGGHQHSRSQYPWARWAGDFPVGIGTPIHAYKAGIVSAVRFLTTSYGKHVRINHAGEESLYAHMSSIGVKVGQQVAAGQIIGKSGSTGNSTGPHVHFELKGGNSPLSNTTGGDDGGGGFDFLGALKDRFAGPMNKLKELGDNPFVQMVSRVPSLIKDALLDKASGAFSALAGAVGNFSNKADIASVLTNALIMNGLPLTQLDNWMRQVQTESGGNPRAVQGNIGDINNRTGNLAQGLLQVIPPTFAAYRSHLLPNDPFNSLANAYAAMNYAKHRYGRNGIEAVIGHGHGYATGTGSATRGLHWVGENGPELMRFRGGEQVFTARDSARMAGGALINGDVTFQSSGDFRHDRDELEFMLRRNRRGGVYA